MAKLIAIDNFGRETVSDRLVLSNITMEEAEETAKKFNEASGENAFDYYKAVEDDYILYDAYANLP